MSAQADCPFCHLNERVIKENKHAFLFLSNPRKMPGHILVCPKRHLEKPWQLHDEEVLSIFELIKSTQEKLVEKFAVGCDIRQTYRPFLQQNGTKVDHVHYHILPRNFEDELYEVSEKPERALFRPLTSREQKMIVRLLS